MNHPDPLVIGIAGGSGSGKTTVAQEILQRVGPERIAFLQHDSYYKDLSGLPPAQRAEVNFDHPHSLETDLLIQHIASLRDGEAVGRAGHDRDAGHGAGRGAGDRDVHRGRVVAAAAARSTPRCGGL